MELELLLLGKCMEIDTEQFRSVQTLDPWMKYNQGVNISIFVHFQTYVFFIARNRIDIIQSLEGRFEESVIAYLFLLNILPILIIPMTWIETQKFTDVLNNWTEFEVNIDELFLYHLSCNDIFL